MLRTTYELEISLEPAMTWEEYEAWLAEQWRQLLEQPGPSRQREEIVQEFFEQHPSLIASALAEAGAVSRVQAPMAWVASQAPLPSYDRRVPDFMGVCSNSTDLSPVLVEIESPEKPWWTQSGTPHHKLTQALDQLNEWKAWFAVDYNVRAFRDAYGLEDKPYGRLLKPIYVLIYGRREEANRTAALIRKRSILSSAPDVVLMTYDRLEPCYLGRELFCVRFQNRSAHALSVPPTMTLGPRLARERQAISGKEAAIARCSLLNAERRDFLVRRTPYWDAWAAKGEFGLVASNASE